MNWARPKSNTVLVEVAEGYVDIKCRPASNDFTRIHTKTSFVDWRFTHSSTKTTQWSDDLLSIRATHIGKTRVRLGAIWKMAGRSATLVSTYTICANPIAHPSPAYVS